MQICEKWGHMHPVPPPGSYVSGLIQQLSPRMILNTDKKKCTLIETVFEINRVIKRTEGMRSTIEDEQVLEECCQMNNTNSD